MHSRHLLLTALGGVIVVGCTDKPSDVDSTPIVCEIEVDETFPANGATNAYYRGDIEFHLSEPYTDATIAVDGVTGTTWTNEDGDVVYFTPDAPLAPSTEYTATITTCQDTPITFSTSALGTTIGDVTSLNSATYTLDLQSGRIVIPPGVGSVLESYLEVTLFMQVEDANSTDISIFGAVADDAGTAQDYCTETLDFPVADFSEAPFFVVGPETTELAVAGYEITIEDLLISGTFAADGSYWGGGVLAGQVDTRPLVDLVEEGGEDNAICEIVAGFGVACETCPGDGEPYCLSIKAVELSGEETSVTIETIEMSDCHANCPDSANNPDCTL
ncbi:MAG: Ig-like domain-containing protein [Alphaproteobacteria bacterium]|nr:Ig-like domain-containing protein [Alphaproteobacteria bacterium]